MNTMSFSPRLAAATTARALSLCLALVGVGYVTAPLARTAPDFKLDDLEGQRVELRDLLASGPVLLHFWASCCHPCHRVLPHLETIQARYADDGLRIVIIAIDETRNLSKVMALFKKQGFSGDVLLDPNQRTFRRYKGNAVPYTLLIAGDGEILFEHVGYRDGDEEVIDLAVAAYVHGETPTPETGESAQPFPHR